MKKSKYKPSTQWWPFTGLQRSSMLAIDIKSLILEADKIKINKMLNISEKNYE